MPEDLAIGEVVADDFAGFYEAPTTPFAGGGGDDLRAVAVFHDGGSGPTIAALAIFFPERLAVRGIEHFDGRLSDVIAHYNKATIVDDRRAAFTEERTHYGFAEVTLPEFFAVEIVAVQASRTEPAVKAFAVGGGSGRGKVVVAVSALMRHALCGHLPPERLTGLAIETHYDVFVHGVRVRDSKDAFGLILGLWQGGIDLAGVDCG